MTKKITYLAYAFMAWCASSGQHAHAQHLPIDKSVVVSHASATRPAIFPTPVAMEIKGGNLVLGKTVTIVPLADVPTATVERVGQLLKSAGIGTIKSVKNLPKAIDGTYLVLGIGQSAATDDALQRSKSSLPEQKEGYTLSSIALDKGNLITLIGRDADGLFYGAQSLRQLCSRGAFPAVEIQDYPAHPMRGTIEGFYGKPWTMKEREKHLQFLATIKANTYVYSPKDDPYARDQWRDPYPADTLAELGRLAKISSDHHINFVYAISPGPTVCFSSEADLKALQDKVDALRGVGVRSFYLALDDIEYTQWNCEQDSITFGPSGPEAAAVAQAHLLNALHAYIKKVDPSAPPLIMVPTEYYDAKETPYKAALRKNLHEDIVRQWTGTDVVPPSISINDAKAATKAFGQATLLWDNYPVNDFAESRGRLLLAPYDRREAGLSKELAGILSNPMNQEAASRVAVTGVVAFAWNDAQYDAQQTWNFAARELAGGDPQTTKALLAFFDTQHLAPTFGTHPWQKQAPALKRQLDAVRDALAYGDGQVRQKALTQLAQQAADFAAAPAVIRKGIADQAFVDEAGPWLDAMELWGQALQSTTAGLQAAHAGNNSAKQHFDAAAQLAREAADIPSMPGATRFEGPVKIADGVLDTFIADAAQLIYVEGIEK